MHVLQLGPHPPPEGGISRNMLAIREELRGNGHHCSIIATSRSTSIVPEPDVYNPRTPFQLLKLLLTLRYDILHLHVGGELSTRMLGLILACSFFRRGRNVFSLHSGGYPLTEAGRAATKNSFRGWLFRRYARIVAVNPLIAEVFERYGVGKNKLRIIYPFAHRSPDPNVEIPIEFSDFERSHAPFLLTVGLLENEYDLFLQIDAMAEVIEKLPDAGLMVVGSGSLKEKLVEAIAAKPYADRIFLVGDVENRVTLHLINDADILLRTTLFDGDAISVREALFLDTPVIATDNGMRPGGLNLIPVGDKKALVEKILVVARSTRTEKVAKPDDTANISETVSLYEELARIEH